MTTRQFDPVFSAALRGELEALADAREEAVDRPRAVRALLDRPQLWVSVVTAVVLIAATIGILRITHAAEPAEHLRGIDPLSQITEPTDPSYVARSVVTLLTARGIRSGTSTFDVPSTVTSVRVYVDCDPQAHYAVGLDGLGESSGDCSRTVAGSFDMPITAGAHHVTVTVGKRSRFSVLIIASPAPTIAAGALIDPLTQVRDLRDPDALTGDTTPVLRTSGTGPAVATTSSARPGRRLRMYFACRPQSSTAAVTIDGRTVTGCMNTIAHWYDFTPSAHVVTAQVAASGPWSLLVVPAPEGSKDTPTPTLLPYPQVGGPLLARARGEAAPASGTYRRPGTSITITTTCRGTGWLEIGTGDGGGTSTRGQACSTTTPSITGFGGPERTTKALRWTVIPHGDVSWTIQISADR